VIFALGQPAVLLGLLLGFGVGVSARATLQRRFASGRGVGGRRRGALRAVGARPRAQQPWTAYLDPYGTVAAVISGAGWGPRPPTTPGRRTPGPVPLVIAVLVHGLLAVAGLAVFLSAGGDRVLLHLVDVSAVLHGDVAPPQIDQRVALGFGMVNLACGLLALVPVPPLEAGLWLWSRLPRSAGARRMAYRLLEEAWGVAILLVLLLLPLGGGRPVLLAVLDAIGDPLLRLV
jgi:hypothetical protein